MAMKNAKFRGKDVKIDSRKVYIVKSGTKKNKGYTKVPKSKIDGKPLYWRNRR